MTLLIYWAIVKELQLLLISGSKLNSPICDSKNQNEKINPPLSAAAYVFCISVTVHTATLKPNI